MGPGRISATKPCNVVSMPMKEKKGEVAPTEEKIEEAALVVEQRISGPDLGHHAGEGEERGR